MPVWIRLRYEINVSNMVEPTIYGILTVKFVSRWPSWKPPPCIHIFFSEKCNPETFQRNPSKYWQTIKAIITEKSKAVDQNISLFLYLLYIQRLFHRGGFTHRKGKPYTRWWNYWRHSLLLQGPYHYQAYRIKCSSCKHVQFLFCLCERGSETIERCWF